MATFDEETETIKRLESMPTLDMTHEEYVQHTQSIKDAYWRRRMSTRTEQEVKDNVCAP